jgi:hypothetical protein
VNDTAAEEAVVATVATTKLGATGAATGAAGIKPDAVVAALVPAEFVAVTEKEYVEPGAKPVTTHDVVAVVQLNEPGVAVTV